MIPSADALADIFEASETRLGPPLRLTEHGLWHAAPLEVVWHVCRLVEERGLLEARGQTPVHVLDAGMGDGRVLAALGTLYGHHPRVHAWGIECDPELFAAARENLDGLRLLDLPRLEIAHGDYTRPETYSPFGAALRDVNVLLNYPDGSESRLKRLLEEHCAPGTTLCVFKPASESHLEGLRSLWTEVVQPSAGLARAIPWYLSAYAL